MRKTAFCICEDKDADQLRSNFKPPTIFCGCTARFVSNLVGNSSHNEANIFPGQLRDKLNKLAWKYKRN